MSMPFYVSPEQVMADKAEFARKGIARGKAIVTMEFDGGVLMVGRRGLIFGGPVLIIRFGRIAFSTRFRWNPDSLEYFREIFLQSEFLFRFRHLQPPQPRRDL